MINEEPFQVRTTGFNFVLRDRTGENQVGWRPKQTVSFQGSHTLNSTPGLCTRQLAQRYPSQRQKPLSFVSSNRKIGIKLPVFANSVKSILYKYGNTHGVKTTNATPKKGVSEGTHKLFKSVFRILLLHGKLESQKPSANPLPARRHLLRIMTDGQN